MSGAFGRERKKGNEMRKALRGKCFLAATVFSAFAPFVGLAIDASLAANGSVAYTYDALGRVTTASYDTGVCIPYSYDANRNPLSETIKVTGRGPTRAGGWLYSHAAHFGGSF